MNTQIASWRSSSIFEAPRLDKTIVYGISISLLLIVAGVVFSGRIGAFFDPISFLLVFGGTIGATLVQHSFADMERAVQMLRQTLFLEGRAPIERMEQLLHISQQVKQRGLLVLEDEAQAVSDTFLRAGLELAVDNRNERDIRRILETEMITTQDQRVRAVQVFQIMGTYAPSMGLIGTLIGLIQLLGSLNDPSTVGPAMSLALITTLYGAVLANVFFLPIAGKMRARCESESVMQSMTLEAVLSIARQESPIILEQRLQRFLTTQKQ